MTEDGTGLDEAAEQVRALAAAELDGDRAALDAALAGGFSAIASDGAVWTRTAFLERARGRRRLGSLARDDVRVERVGRVIIVTSTERARTPLSPLTDQAVFRTRAVFVEDAGELRLAALDRVVVDAAGPAVRRLRLRLASWLMATSAFLLLLVAVLHFGAKIPLGFVTLREKALPEAGYAEALLGVLLGLATYGLVAHGHCRHARRVWRYAIGTLWFSVFLIFFGLFVVSRGSGSAVATNVLEHVLMLALIVPELVLLESPAGRVAVRADALVEL